MSEKNERVRGHKLLTEDLKKRFKEVGPQDTPDAIVIAKYFHPLSSWTWYATAYHEEDRVFFGLVQGFERELGYFSLDELESTVALGLPVERDIGFPETPLKALNN